MDLGNPNIQGKTTVCLHELKNAVYSKLFHEDTLCQGIFFEWLETLTYLMTKTLQCLSAHESPSDEAN